MLSIPRFCLFKTFLFQLTSSSNLSCSRFKLFPQSTLSTVFYCLNKFGRVSSYFRDIVVDSIAHFFTTEKPLIDFNLHYSFLPCLTTLLPNVSFSIKTQLSSGLCIPYKLDKLTLQPRFTSDYAEFLPSFLQNNDFSLLQECTLLYSISEDIISRISSFPLLTSLNFLELTADGFTMSDLVFPPFLSKLTNLKLHCFSSCYGRSFIRNGKVKNTADISALVNLRMLDFSFPYIGLVGFKMLPFLKNLSLEGVVEIDVFHDEMRLDSIDLSFVHDMCVEDLFSRKDNICEARLKIKNCKLPPKFEYISNLCYRDQTIPLDNGYGSISTASTPLIEELRLGPGDRRLEFSVTLHDLKYLHSLQISCEHVTFTTTPSFTNLFISKLDLYGVEFGWVDSLLMFSPYLKSLSLSSIPQSSIKYLRDFKRRPLEVSPYLTSLELRNIGFLVSALPVLPKLKYVSFYSVTDFSFSVLPEKLPLLACLKLSNVKIDSRVSEPNYSLRFLHVDTCQVTCVDFLLPFERLDRVSLIQPRFEANFKNLLVPRNLTSAKVKLDSRLFVLFDFATVTSLSGSLVVKESSRSEQFAQDLIEFFKRTNPNVWLDVTVSVSTYY
ncbi:hypothetical protein RCL1_002440 [Eukaryota sp. TZLM3-RCL]